MNTEEPLMNANKREFKTKKKLFVVYSRLFAFIRGSFAVSFVVIRGYSRLIRLPNVFTALADIWAGYLIMRGLTQSPGYAVLGELCGVSAALYLAGMAFNDIADRHVDKLSRPERPIPSGQVSLAGAIVCAGSLMIAGILLSATAHRLSLILALFLVSCILAYDFFLKGNVFFGPLMLGACRFLNMLIGMSASEDILILLANNPFWQAPVGAALSVGIYTIGLTAFSAQEELGKQRRALILGSLFCGGGILLAGFGSHSALSWVFLGPLAVVLVFLILRLARLGTARAARDLVCAGVFGICLLDAGLLIGCVGRPAWLTALACAALVLPSLLIAQRLAQKEA
ncbi:MAG: UbiA family prenyltransferase [Planctomycetota bacterium]